jgi:hypothetical protein
MFTNDIKSDLLVELSDEQQQLVTGGSSGDFLKDKLSTYFKTDATITLLDVAQQSGPRGSTNLQKFQHDTISIDTAAMKNLEARLS